MTELTERVAKAMAEADAHNASWKLYVREASAAIEAVRDWLKESSGDTGSAIHRINAALKPTEKQEH